MLLGCELPGLMRAARAQALNALVTAQIDTGSINLVSGVRSNLVSDVQSGALLVRALTLPWRPPRVPAGRRCAQRYTGVARPPGRTPACSASLAETRAGARAQNLCKEQGLQLTSVSLASAIYSTPVKPKPDTRPQLAAGIAVAGCIVFAFVGWIIYLESEKTRSCCGYSWCAGRLRPCARARACYACCSRQGGCRMQRGTAGRMHMRGRRQRCAHAVMQGVQRGRA